MENENQEAFDDLRSALNKTLNELLEAHHLTYGENKIITDRWYGDKINELCYQIDLIV
jgi:ABC-type amino acid transport substrate-binding protein